MAAWLQANATTIFSRRSLGPGYPDRCVGFSTMLVGGRPSAIAVSFGPQLGLRCRCRSSNRRNSHITGSESTNLKAPTTASFSAPRHRNQDPSLFIQREAGGIQYIHHQKQSYDFSRLCHSASLFQTNPRFHWRTRHLLPGRRTPRGISERATRRFSTGRPRPCLLRAIWR